MEGLFWFSVLFIAYTYIGYPLLIGVLARTRTIPPCNPDQISTWPTVTVVIAVYNEQQRVLKKIQNLRSLNYPADKLDIIFVSDGSTDDTVSVLNGAGVRVLSYAERHGKAYALNLALQHAHSDVIVFTDVRQQLNHDALRWLIARLQQDQVGAVSGELIHVDPANATAAQIGLYWRYEKWIRKAESRFASTAGVTGALYAIRRNDYVPLVEGTVLDDFLEPMHIARRGKLIKFEPNAQITDELQADMRGERKRKVRTLTGNFQAFVQQPWLFSPRQNPIWLQFLSHKVFRLLVPYAMLLALLSSLFADGWLYRIAALAQIVFYLIAISAMLDKPISRHRLVNFAGVFVEMNWAAVLAARNFVTGQLNARWEKT